MSYLGTTYGCPATRKNRWGSMGANRGPLRGDRRACEPRTQWARSNRLYRDRPAQHLGRRNTKLLLSLAGKAYRKKCCTFGAILARNAFTARTWTTHRPTSYELLLQLSVSGRRRLYGRRYPTLRLPDRLETAPR